jgi:phosphotransferase system  glucose/maltose/N-acetylglucosamine-specific IIC component
MTLQILFIGVGIIFAFVTVINYNNWVTTNNDQWYWLSWVTLIMSIVFIEVSFFIDRTPNYTTPRREARV